MAGVPYSETPEGLAYMEQCRREDAAMLAFIESHSREEVAARIDAARGNPRWKRWWEPEPGPPTKWNPPLPVRRAVALRCGAAEGRPTPVTCARCGAAGEVRWKRNRIRFAGLHLDHIKPRARGGADAAENLQLLCPSCNFRKGARWEG